MSERTDNDALELGEADRVPPGYWDEMGKWMKIKPSDVERLRKDRDELAAALRPFAALLQKHHEGIDYPDDRPIFGINDALITVGSLRRACALLARLDAERKA